MKTKKFFYLILVMFLFVPKSQAQIFIDMGTITTDDLLGRNEQERFAKAITLETLNNKDFPLEGGSAFCIDTLNGRSIIATAGHCLDQKNTGNWILSLDNSGTYFTPRKIWSIEGIDITFFLIDTLVNPVQLEAFLSDQEVVVCNVKHTPPFKRGKTLPNRSVVKYGGDFQEMRCLHGSANGPIRENEMFEISVMARPGASGGPVVNANLKVIGMVVAECSSEMISLVVPAAVLKKKLIEYKKKIQ